MDEGDRDEPMVIGEEQSEYCCQNPAGIGAMQTNVATSANGVPVGEEMHAMDVSFCDQEGLARSIQQEECVQKSKEAKK